MDKEQATQEENSLVYVVGALIVIAVVVAGILLWPKPKKTTVAPAVTEEQIGTQPTLTKLVCEKEWYNPVVGVPKFYLQAEGGNVDPAKTVDCTFTLNDGSKNILSEKVTVDLNPAPERNGNTFRCGTKALENLPMNVTLKMTTTVQDDQGASATCAGNVILRPQ